LIAGSAAFIIYFIAVGLFNDSIAGSSARGFGLIDSIAMIS